MGENRGHSLVGVTSVMVVSVMALSALLTGCGSAGGDQPSALLTPTARATATTLGSSSSPPTPTSQTPRQQVEATVRAFYAAMDRAIRTGDVADYWSTTLTTCSCRDFGVGIERLFAHATTRGAGVSLVSIDDVTVTGVAASVSTKSATAAYESVERKSGEVHRFPAGRDRSALGVVRDRSGRWRVSTVVYLDRVDQR